MLPPQPRDYDIISHKPLERSASTSNFRIKACNPYEPSKASYSQASFVTRANTNKRNEESWKLFPEKPETVKNFDRQIESKTFWSERKQEDEAKKTTFNCSSVNFDFLTHTKTRGPLQSVPSLKGNLFAPHRRKVITELDDLRRSFAPKYHPDYGSLYREDPLCFHNVKGPFSHFMDDCNRTGKIMRPQFKFTRNK